MPCFMLPKVLGESGPSSSVVGKHRLALWWRGSFTDGKRNKYILNEQPCNSLCHSNVLCAGRFIITCYIFSWSALRTGFFFFLSRFYIWIRFANIQNLGMNLPQYRASLNTFAWRPLDWGVWYFNGKVGEKLLILVGHLVQYIWTPYLRGVNVGILNRHVAVLVTFTAPWGLLR